MDKKITDSNGRAISFKEMDAVDMLDLLEAAGAQSTNQGWMRMAMVVASVTDIDGVPVPRARTKEQVRAIAGQLGNPGLIALNEAIFGDGADVSPQAENPDRRTRTDSPGDVAKN